MPAMACTEMGPLYSLPEPRLWWQVANRGAACTAGELPRGVVGVVIQFESTSEGAAGYFVRGRLPGDGRVGGVAVGEDGFPQVLWRARGPGSFLRRIEQIARGRAWRPLGGREGGRPGLSAADELNRAALVGGGRSAGIRGGGGRGRAAGARLALG